MKKTIIVLALTLLVTSVYAETFMTVIGSVTTADKTNKTQSVTVQQTDRIKYKTSSSVCSVYLNTTTAKTGYPIAANTENEGTVPANTTALVFKCTTTATINYMK